MDKTFRFRILLKRNQTARIVTQLNSRNIKRKWGECISILDWLNNSQEHQLHSENFPFLGKKMRKQNKDNNILNGRIEKTCWDGEKIQFFKNQNTELMRREYSLYECFQKTERNPRSLAVITPCLRPGKCPLAPILQESSSLNFRANPRSGLCALSFIMKEGGNLDSLETVRVQTGKNWSDSAREKKFVVFMGSNLVNKTFWVLAFVFGRHKLLSHLIELINFLKIKITYNCFAQGPYCQVVIFTQCS